MKSSGDADAPIFAVISRIFARRAESGITGPLGTAEAAAAGFAGAAATATGGGMFTLGGIPTGRRGGGGRVGGGSDTTGTGAGAGAGGAGAGSTSGRSYVDSSVNVL